MRAHPPEVGLVRHEDLVQPFMLHKSHLRGRMVRLSPVVNDIVMRHDNPPIVSRLLGEMLTLAALLSANLPEGGILTLQAKGDGLVRFIVVDAVHGGGLRGYADLSKDARETLIGMEENHSVPTMQEILGKGYLAITLDMGYGEPYQGIVPLEGDSLSDAVAFYFSQSQQLDVMFRLSVNRRIAENGNAEWAAGGIMLERMPEEGGKQDGKVIKDELHGWRYNALLVNTATEEELLDPHLAPSALLYRLFNEAGVWIHECSEVSASCRCSRGKIHNVLASMEPETLDEMKVDGEIIVTCQFCNKDERFDDAAISELKRRH